MYRPVDPNVSFPAMEEAILKFWQEESIFSKSIDQKDPQKEFVFYDGPPFATGLPHFGHFVPGTIKDVVPRYKAMQGYKVDRRFGWDCHGLPVEYEVEKELGISGKKQIEEYGIAKFNEACRSIVLRYTREWQRVITRLGRWVDFAHDYKTMDLSYMESIWWVVKQLWQKNLLLEGYYILPYCPRCSTALSNFELNLGGYQDVHDPAITVKFKLQGEDNTFILAWTTTPWTLPSNLALALGPQVDYVKVQDGNEFYILAKERLGAYYKQAADCQIRQEFKGQELAGREYVPLFPFFKDLAAQGAFRTVTADFVTTEDGTGIVHLAPGFGEDDYNTLKHSGIPVVCPVDAEGNFTAEVSAYRGLFVKDADKKIIQDLKDQHKLVRRDQYLHPYPHCWRCKSPLIYKAITSWFVDIDKIKDKMLAANDQIYWVPAHLKHGRFGKWLEGARNWAISRNRYWGNPIPIWRCAGCNDLVCIGAKAELEQKSGVKVKDLHKHFIDDITFPCAQCGQMMRRIPEVLDCWFESGAMPYAQNHYPFENKKHFEEHFPADFISEALDQTRGWFYTLTVLAAALFDAPAFKNVVVNGMVLAADGKKMSKSERNYTDPTEVMNTYGADALRLFLINSAVLKADDLRFSDEGVKEILKNVILPLWNAYSFFITYANIDRVKPSALVDNPANPLDKWILSEKERMIGEVTAQMEVYDLQKAVAPFIDFIDLLNNWYIRRSRRRFWRSGNDSDKQEAYNTLYAVLKDLALVACPFIPFITEEIYRNLKTDEDPQSIHLCDYPRTNELRRDPALEMKMQVTRKAVSMGRAIRALHNLKIRQPLKALHLVTKNQEEHRVLREMEEIIKEELNVKEVIYRENEEDLVTYLAQANFKLLGKQLGKDMKTAAGKIQGLSMKEIVSLLDGAVLALDVNGTSFDLTQQGIIVQRIEKENLKVLNEGSLTVALDPQLSEELIQEGMVRDLVRQIQSLRKEKGLLVTDRIELFVHGPADLRPAIENFEEYLTSETLATSWVWQRAEGAVEVKYADEACFIALRKAVKI